MQFVITSTNFQASSIDGTDSFVVKARTAEGRLTFRVTKISPKGSTVVGSANHAIDTLHNLEITAGKLAGLAAA